MKAKIVTKNLKFLFIVLLMFLSIGIFAQNKHLHHRPHRPNGPSVPLDGGVLLLLAGAGAAYFGIRKNKKI